MSSTLPTLFPAHRLCNDQVVIISPDISVWSRLEPWSRRILNTLSVHPLPSIFTYSFTRNFPARFNWTRLWETNGQGIGGSVRAVNDGTSFINRTKETLRSLRELLCRLTGHGRRDGSSSPMACANVSTSLQWWQRRRLWDEPTEVFLNHNHRHNNTWPLHRAASHTVQQAVVSYNSVSSSAQRRRKCLPLRIIAGDERIVWNVQFNKQNSRWHYGR